MAIDAEIDYVDGLVGLYLLPIGKVEKVSDDPIVPGYTVPSYLYYYWDAAKLEEHNVYDFLAIEVIDIGDLKDLDLEVLDRLNLPRVNVPEAGMVDSTVSDVLRWARKVFPSRYSTASA